MIQRRAFLAAAASTAALALTSTARASESPEDAGARQYFELRTYHFASATKQQAYAEFLAQAGIPALNRAGVNMVGMFQLTAKDNPKLKTADAEATDLWVLLPHNSIESVLALEAKLGADAAYQQAGKAILNAPKSDPAFTRYDSTLLLAMSGFPRVATGITKAPGRLFELRTYESATAERAANKLDMFNAGEFAVFARAGMPGVFFGGAILGENLPQLTYMVAHEDGEQVKAHWDAFRNDPEWKKLSDLNAHPEYKDNVSKIQDRFVRPMAGSQI